MENKESKKRKKTKFEKIYIGITVVVVVACLCIGLWVVYGQSIMASATASTEEEEVQSDITIGISSVGDMSTYIEASGTVSVPNTTSVSLPISGVVENVYVQEGSLVNEGDILYTITNSSLQSGMQSLEEELDSALDAVTTEEDSYTITKIKATQDGVVKMMVAEEDLEVEELLKANDQLCVVSTAGTMYMEIKSETLAVGDTVTVRIGDENESGEVVSVINGVARIEISTDEYDVGDEAEALSSGGSSLGSAPLGLTSYVEIQSPMGTISYVYVEENDEVEQGDMLFKVSVPDKTSKEEFSKIDELYEKVALMNNYIKDGAVLAPYDGIIGSVNATSGAQMEADMSAVEIKPSSGFEVTISVDENELKNIYEGQSVEVTFADEYVLEGEIIHINYNAVTSSSSATFTVYISLYECDEIDQNKILPGMVGDASIIISSSENAVRVPLEALFTDSSGTYVMLFTGDRDITQYEVYDIPTQICYVETGITSELYAEILSGIESGQQVIMVSSSNSDMYPGFMGRDFSGGMPGGDFTPQDRGGSQGGMPGGGN